MRDLRKYTGETQIRLIIGGLLILFVVGDGLIYLIYGPSPALLGLICMVAGLAPLVLIWAALSLVDWIVRRVDGG